MTVNAGNIAFCDVLWAETILKLVPYDCFDIACFHPYRPPSVPEDKFDWWKLDQYVKSWSFHLIGLLLSRKRRRIHIAKPMRNAFPWDWFEPVRHGLVAIVTIITLTRPALAQTNYQQLAFFGPAQGLGVNPQAGLILGADGALYGVSTAGTATGFGALFGLRPDGTSHEVLRFLGSDTNVDKSVSIAGLAMGVDGTLFGTTQGGGNFGVGSVFRVNPADRRFQVLHSFGAVTNDGGNVVAALAVGNDGTLYGTTEDGGANRSGILFKLNADGTGYQILHQFGATATDGSSPIAPLIVGKDGALYGTTVNGGSSNEFAGTVFKWNIDGSVYTVLHSFSFGEGYNPRTALVQAADGLLYGTTGYGGDYDGGIVYRLATNGSNYSVVYSFRRTDAGSNGSVLLPSSLIQGLDGALYGTTFYGGITNTSATNGFGTVFKLGTGGSNYTVLHNFTGGDGRNPQAGLVSGSDGVLYGTTPNGGYQDAGVVFKLTFSPPLQVVAIDAQIDGTGAQLVFSGAPGEAWSIQATTNLVAAGGWQIIGSATNDSNGLFQFLDAGAAKLPSRFYRATRP
ncbi:MAG: choice-of-anchor tandem repeat GloVer-containing protein [Limisphaerales bacterium]